MTRVNCVPVGELTGPHLVAEYRELPRVFGHVLRAQVRGLTPDKLDAPPTYTMGRGHVKFFYTRLRWLVTRQQQLIDEMLRRGYRPSYLTSEYLATGIDECWLGDWSPTEADLAISRGRIAERLGLVA